MAPGPEDEVTQAERRRILREGTTFHQQAFADEVNQGRFAAIGVPTVVGAQPLPKYPAAAAHQADPVGPELPLGYSVDQVEPIGPSAVSLLPAEQTDAPAGATSSSENLPPVQDESGDAGASLSH